jgi:hypothetical protein
MFPVMQRRVAWAVQLLLNHGGRKDMTTRTLALVGLLCVGTAGGLAYTPPVVAGAYVDVGIDIAPPAPRYERVVVRPGYVWTPGYWRWDNAGRRHVWVGGVFVAERPGFVWIPHRWDHGPDGRWHFQEGHWGPG